MPPPPPPLLDSARIVAYAAAPDGRRLAIGIDLAANEARLFQCDDTWSVLSSSAHASLDDAKTAASGEGAFEWQVAEFDISSILGDAEQAPPACSFCGRAATDAERMVSGPNGAAICNVCIRDLHRRLHPRPS